MHPQSLAQSGIYLQIWANGETSSRDMLDISTCPDISMLLAHRGRQSCGRSHSNPALFRVLLKGKWLMTTVLIPSSALSRGSTQDITHVFAAKRWQEGERGGVRVHSVYGVRPRNRSRW